MKDSPGTGKKFREVIILSLNAIVMVGGIALSLIWAHTTPGVGNPYTGLWALVVGICFTIFALGAMLRPGHRRRIRSVFAGAMMVAGLILMTSFGYAQNFHVLWVLTWLCPLISYLVSGLDRGRVFNKADGSTVAYRNRALGKFGTVLGHLFRLALAALVVSFLIQGLTLAVLWRGPPDGSAFARINKFQSTGSEAVDIRYQCAGPTNSTQPVIVLMHGAHSHGVMMNGVLDKLRQRGRRACLFDRQGYGWSDRLFGSNFPWADYANELELRLVLVAFVGEEQERGKVELWGFGSGALIAAQYASRYPLEVASTVLIEPQSVDPLPSSAIRFNQSTIVPEEAGVSLAQFQRWFWPIATGYIHTYQALHIGTDGVKSPDLRSHWLYGFADSKIYDTLAWTLAEFTGRKDRPRETNLEDYPINVPLVLYRTLSGCDQRELHDGTEEDPCLELEAGDLALVARANSGTYRRLTGSESVEARILGDPSLFVDDVLDIRSRVDSNGSGGITAAETS